MFRPLVFLFSIQSIWDQNSIHTNHRAYAKQHQPIYMSHSEKEGGCDEEKAYWDHKALWVSQTLQHKAAFCHAKPQEGKLKRELPRLSSLPLSVELLYPKGAVDFCLCPAQQEIKEIKFRVWNKNTNGSCFPPRNKKHKIRVQLYRGDLTWGILSPHLLILINHYKSQEMKYLVNTVAYFTSILCIYVSMYLPIYQLSICHVSTCLSPKWQVDPFGLYPRIPSHDR